MKTLQKTLLTISLIISSLVFSQNDLKARIEFEEAEKQFNGNNFSEALQYLENTETLIGKWTPKVSFMKIESLNELADLNDLESENSKKLIKEVKLYMDFCNKQKENVVMEKFKVVYTIDESIKQISKVALEKKMPEYLAGKDAFDKKNYNEAMNLWNKAAAKGNGNAMYEIGKMYYSGDGFPQDYAKAMEWYLEAANKGNIDAMSSIGENYLYGHGGLTKDYNKAMEWYLKAANKGNPNAMCGMGNTYYYANNAAKSKEWYLKAANKGNPDAMYRMGNIYRNENNAKAMEWYLKAANKGNSDAMYEIGNMHSYNHGFPQDYAKAMEWYLKAANKGNLDAMSTIGKNYLYGDGGLTKDYNKAMEWFLKGRDNRTSLFHIASMYERGLGVTKDYSKALEWYLKASQKGFYYCIEDMAKIYEEGGYGVKQDKKKAAELMTEYQSKKDK